MHIVESISVYNPADDWEQAIQTAYHERNEDWLPSFACQLASKAVAQLKCFDDWVDNKDLQYQRASYFFNPAFTKNLSTLVFVTFPLFLHDIMENEKISSYFHDPIVLMSKPLAHFLFKDYPVHIVIDADKLNSANSEAKFLFVGGLGIASEDINLPADCILEISNSQQQNFQKAAATEMSRDVYEIDEHQRDIHGDDQVWDKQLRQHGHVESVQSGEHGDVTIRYESGDTVDISQREFDYRFIIADMSQACITKFAEKAYPIVYNGKRVTVTEAQISQLIKEQIRNSRSLMKIFEDFEVDPNRLENLQIVIVDLDKKFAETDSKTMKLNPVLFKKDFFKESFFVVSHELVHWLSRIKEQDAYFNDPEETLGFVSSIAYELEQGLSIHDIYQRIYPKIEWHFNDDNDARQFFENMLQKAKSIAA